MFSLFRLAIIAVLAVTAFVATPQESSACGPGPLRKVFGAVVRVAVAPVQAARSVIVEVREQRAERISERHARVESQACQVAFSDPPFPSTYASQMASNQPTIAYQPSFSFPLTNRTCNGPNCR